MSAAATTTPATTTTTPPPATPATGTPAPGSSPSPATTPPAGAPATGTPAPAKTEPPAPLLGTPPSEEVTANGETPDVEVKLPDGVRMDTGMMDAFKPLAKELGLKSDGAQKLVDLLVKSQTAQAAAAEASQQQQIQQWNDAVQADKEMGGAAFKDSMLHVQKALQKFATPELRELFKTNVVGSNPELVRFVVRVGKALSEDSIGGTSGNTPGGDKDPNRILYPSMFPRE